MDDEYIAKNRAPTCIVRYSKSWLAVAWSFFTTGKQLLREERSRKSPVPIRALLLRERR